MLDETERTLDFKFQRVDWMALECCSPFLSSNLLKILRLHQSPPPPRPAPFRFHLCMAPGHSAYNDVFILNISRSRVDGQHGIVAKWESLAIQIEGDLPCPRSRQVRESLPLQK